jgi:hypothetical protein
MGYVLSRWQVVDNRNGKVLGYVKARGVAAALRKARSTYNALHSSCIGVVLVEMEVGA